MFEEETVPDNRLPRQQDEEEEGEWRDVEHLYSEPLDNFDPSLQTVSCCWIII